MNKIERFIQDLRLDTEEGKKKTIIIMIIVVICFCIISCIMFFLLSPKEQVLIENSATPVLTQVISTEEQIFGFDFQLPSTSTPFIIEGCENVKYESRLKPGMIVFLSLEPALNQRIRSTPNIEDGNIITLLPPGSELRIIDGPTCTNGWFMWYVESTTSNIKGWTSEGDNSHYWLIPK